MPNDEQSAPARPAADNHYWGPWAVRPEALAILADAARRGPAALAAADVQAAYGRDREMSVPVTGGVAVLSLRGLITPYPSYFSYLFGGSYGLVMFREMFRAAVADDSISAILLDIDSPGGSIDLLPETAAEIREARGSKPIVALANTMAASAAYWIASQADEVVVTPSGQVGSIGVFLLHAEYSRMDQEMGVTTTLIRAGRFKAEASPYKPLTDEARDALQGQVDEYYDMFLSDVAAGRRVSADDARANYGEGRMATAQRAVSMGLADRVETFDEVVVRLAGGGGGSSARAFAAEAENARAQTEAEALAQLDATRELAATAEATARALAEAGDTTDEPRADSEPFEPDTPPENNPPVDEPNDTPDDAQPDAEKAKAADLTPDDRRRIAAVLLG